MPKIVSNTTPIISLLKINQLQILKDLYGEIFIPQEVFHEIEAGKDAKRMNEVLFMSINPYFIGSSWLKNPC